jgi:hypothetical protein
MGKTGDPVKAPPSAMVEDKKENIKVRIKEGKPINDFIERLAYLEAFLEENGIEIK